MSYQVDGRCQRSALMCSEAHSPLNMQKDIQAPQYTIHPDVCKLRKVIPMPLKVHPFAIVIIWSK